MRIGRQWTKRSATIRILNDNRMTRPHPNANRGVSQRRRDCWLAALLAVVAVVTFGVTALLVTIFEHRQEARTPFVRLVEVNEVTTDPVPWGTNWPSEFDSYRRTVDDVETEYGGSSAMPASKLDEHPWLRRLYAGYAFSIDYREARGHAYMLFDQEVTERVTKRPQSGACLHCHAVDHPDLSSAGLGSEGRESGRRDVGGRFQLAGRDGRVSRSPARWTTARPMPSLLKTPDGTPGESTPLFPGGAVELRSAPSDVDATPTRANRIRSAASIATTLRRCRVRVTRPGFIHGIAALAASDDRVPHLPSIERWRAGDRKAPYDPNVDASRQEMRSFRLRAMPRRVLLRHEGDAVLSVGQRPQGRADRSDVRRAQVSRTARRSTISSTARPARKFTKPSTRSSNCGARACTPAAA